MKQGDTGLVQALRRIVGDLAALPVETSVVVAHIVAALQDVLQQHTEIPAQLQPLRQRSLVGLKEA